MNEQFREKYLTEIMNLERKYDVKSWKVKGIDLWIIVRNLIFVYKVDKHETVKIENKSYDYLSKPQKMKIALREFFEVISFLFFKKVDVVSFSYKLHRGEYNNRSYVKLIDSVFDELEKDNLKCYLIESDGFNKNNNYYKTKRVVPYFLFNKLLQKIFISKKKKEKFRNQILSVIPAEFLDEPQIKDIDFLDIIRRLVYIVSLVEIFKRVFKFKKISTLYSVCYYSNVHTAAVIAANLLDIETIEMQHGPMTNHYAFSSLDVEKFCNSLPRFFWCWDSVSANQIDSWANNTAHKSMLRFNPWVNFLKNTEIVKIKKNHSLPTIMISLQPIGEILDGFVVETIKKTIRKYNWCIRLHPNQIAGIEKIKTWFEEKGIMELVDVEQVTTLPLPTVLRQTDIHLTKFSGTFIEALAYNVPTIFIDPKGKALFADYIQNGQGHYLEKYNSEDLCRKIEFLLE